MSGIMMSISTMSMPAVSFRRAIASRPLSAGDHDHALAFQKAGQREQIAHVVIDDQYMRTFQ